MYKIENWWKHNGCYDREQASRIPYNKEDNYLQITDDWWNGLTDKEKKEVYEDFFFRSVRLWHIFGICNCG